MYGMSLPEFLSYKNYIDIQNSIEEAIYKDREQELKQSRNNK